MKPKLRSLFIVGVLLLGIFQVMSVNAFRDQKNQFDLDNNNENYLPTDIEPEIQAISQYESAVIPSFDPSPVSLNNITSEISTKVVEETERLIIQIDLEKQVVRPGEQLKYMIQATRGFNPASEERLVVEIIEGEFWGWYNYYYYDSVNFEDLVLWKETVTTNSEGTYEGSFTSSNSGRYSIIIRSETNDYYESRSFNIAEIGIFWRVSREFVEGQPHYSVVYVLNTSDFSPIVGASVTLTGETYSYEFNTMNSEELFA